jgi:hypothetical protein
MLSLATARALSQAGLLWRPAPFDFFSVPDRGMDDRIFVLADMPAALMTLHGEPMVTFEGAVEWAMDFVAAGEVVWLPTEAQLREQLAARLVDDRAAVLTLHMTPDGWRCALEYHGQAGSWPASEASEAYAAALLSLLGPKT